MNIPPSPPPTVFPVQDLLRPVERQAQETARPVEPPGRADAAAADARRAEPGTEPAEGSPGSDRAAGSDAAKTPDGSSLASPKARGILGAVLDVFV